MFFVMAVVATMAMTFGVGMLVLAAGTSVFLVAIKAVVGAQIGVGVSSVVNERLIRWLLLGVFLVIAILTLLRPVL